MKSTVSRISTDKSFVIALAWGLAATASWGQSGACSANEDVVTFNFAATSSTTATGSSGTWAARTISNVYTVATPGTLRSNTIDFNVSISGASWVNGYPAQGTQGGVPNSLDLNMDSTAPGDYVNLVMTFNRPMSKLRFNMYDVDRSNPNWQDVVRITGWQNGVLVPIPALTATTPGNYSTSTVTGGNEIVTTVSGNCPSDTSGCNVQIDFANPVDLVSVFFQAGPSISNPSSQRIGINNFSYCVPKRDLRLTKVDTTPTFVAGQTGNYTLTITNAGGAATAGNYTVSDTLSSPGVSFINPQTPGGGWACSVSTVSYANDTSTCVRSTALAANASVALPLTVAVSPEATATNFDNRAKVFGGGDEFKTTLTSTGPLANCSSTNEGAAGGGSTSNAGCAFENTLLSRQGALSITKSNALSSVTAGQTTSYSITVANGGPSSAHNAVLADPAVAGLNCTSVTCSVTSGAAVCPAPGALTISALQGSGIALPTFPPGSSLSLQVNCTVTATGVP